MKRWMKVDEKMDDIILIRGSNFKRKMKKG